MLPPLEFGLDPARGGQHVVLCQQLVELLLPAIININIRVMLIITVTFVSVSVILMIIFWNVSHLSWVAIKSCALKYCFCAP